MNRNQFDEALQKLNSAPVTKEVLHLVLASDTNAEIAQSRGKSEGTIRKQVSNLYERFGIARQFTDDPNFQRRELKTLFKKYKPEWLSEKAMAKPNQESVETYAGSGKNLMSLATSMLEPLSFDEKFKKNITSSYTGYRLKNPGARAKKYLLVLAQRKEGLCISVSKDVLEPHILCLKYYEDAAPDIILGKFWIIPSKEDIFLASMQTHYPTLLDSEVTGSFTLNEGAFLFHHNIDIDNSIDFIESPEEFEVNSLGSHNCYLVINENQLFPDTLQVCITSREILEEFIRYFGEILMENY
ncbi:helix-turn-helix transcriptional regulator [Coleofasciculus chthonoplastes]|uniref:helix-turn-helix transcriptional regulator n=1 Tax=Coleofasciculus chthonoplastes TaxID=64178 RepID=UPI0032F32DF5